jgi:hypothetical protein
MMSRAKRAPALTPYDVLHQRREFVPLRLTAQIGQTKVEDDPVERFGQGTLQTGDAGSLTFHSKALECHQHHEGIRRVDLVVDQENPWP